jgi:hypothetical protein
VSRLQQVWILGISNDQRLEVAEMETKIVMEGDMNLMEIGKQLCKMTCIIITILLTGKDKGQTFIIIMSTKLMGHMLVTTNQTTTNDLKMVIIRLVEDLGREVKLTQDEAVETSLVTS